MATADWTTYYDQNPIIAWSRNRWDVVDQAAAQIFREQSYFTPLTRWVDYSGLAEQGGQPGMTQLTTGREMLPGHVNYEELDWRQRYTTADYLDFRDRKITADKRYGGKVQLDRVDELVNMVATRGTSGFIMGVLRQHLGRSVARTMEMLSRNALLSNVNVSTYAGGGSDLASLAASKTYTFDVAELRNVKLRLSFRSKEALQTYGQYAMPVPGMNVQLVLCTPGTIYDVWNSFNGEYVERLTALQDNRILNGDVVAYEGFVFMPSWEVALFNQGNIVRQVAVTQPINAGDGAPDPDADDPVHGVWYVGQDSSGLKHYVQCYNIDEAYGTYVAGDLPAVGDVVTLHTARTNAWGVTDGASQVHGQSMNLEVAAVDTVNNRIAFSRPVMADYLEPFTVTTLGGSSATAAVGSTAYAYVTKAQHVHPIYFIGARGGNLFAIQQGVRYYNPPAIDDFLSVERYTWDMRGAMNKWNPDIWEIHYAAGSFGNRGDVAVS